MRLPLALSALACALSAAALGVALGRPAPPPAAAAVVEVAPAPHLALAGIELLLPHLARGAPFARAHAVAVALAAGDTQAAALLAPLGPLAAEGAPTARQLLETFRDTADAALLAEMGVGQGWLARRVAATMRLGAALGGGTSPALAALGAAGRHLAARDLAGAATALAALDGPAAEAVAAWRDGLARRLALDAAAARLAAHAEAVAR